MSSSSESDAGTRISRWAGGDDRFGDILERSGAFEDLGDEIDEPDLGYA